MTARGIKRRRPQGVVGPKINGRVSIRQVRLLGVAAWRTSGRPVSRGPTLTRTDQQHRCNDRDQGRSSQGHCGPSTHVTAPMSIIGSTPFGMRSRAWHE